MNAPWLYSRFADSLFILAPAFAVTLLVEVLPQSWMEHQKINAWSWLLLVVFVDVAHVYSTLWRTYFDKAAVERYRTLLIVIPLGCWVAGVLAYSAGPMVFWRLLAYIAVFHFVRQQYGFLRLYSRRERPVAWTRWLDGAAIYIATICLLPDFVATKFKVSFYFGGTTLLILVGVALDTVSQIQTFLLTRDYEGFMKNAKLRGRRG